MQAALLLAAVLSMSAQERSRPQLVVVHGDDVSADTLASLSRRWPPRYVAASDAEPSDLKARRVILVGTPANNPWIAKLELPELALDAKGFSWRGIRYDGANHLLQLRAPNPWSPERSLELILGALPDAPPRRRAAVHIRREGRTVLLELERGGERTSRRFEPATAPILETEHVRFFVEDAHDVDEAALRRFAATLGSLDRRVDVHVYPSLELKGLMTDDTRSVHEDNGAFHVVLGFDHRPARAIVESFDTADESRLLTRGRALLRTAGAPALDHFDVLARRLLETSAPPSLVALSDDARFEATSPLVADAVSASFARYAEGREGAVAALEPAWVRFLATSPDASSPIPSLPKGFQRGFTFAHEGYSIHNGYLSGQAVDSLVRLRGLGTDAVAIIPYAFMSEPSAIVPLDVPTRAGSETDEDVIHAIRAAKAEGMTVMLKPQIWVRRSWPGEIAGKTPEDDARFFDEYGRWIRHYALIAETERVPLLAIGTELQNMTRGHLAAWHRLIEDVRCLYGGKLVYAANWGAEVEQVEFWDRLDYIGVDFYYPLSFEPDASDEALAEGFHAALRKIRAVHERYEKPVLFTEIGYASTKSPWMKPHASDKEPAPSAEDQARAYEIALAAIAENTAWIHGAYWWKWPTNLARGGEGHRGFTPNGKSAESVVRRWYLGRLQ